MSIWLDDIKQALVNLGGIAEYNKIYDEVKKIRKDPLPDSWKAIIRREIETASSDSDAYGNKNDLFFSVDGIGNGVWGLREYVEGKTKIACDVSYNLEKGNEIGLTLRSPTTIYRILRDTMITRELKLLYHDTCQICGKQLELFNETYSEAHHIKPLGLPHNGPDKKENIIIVCPDCHVKLDYGAIKIEKLVVSKHNIDDEYIDYHNEKIYQGNIANISYKISRE